MGAVLAHLTFVCWGGGSRHQRLAEPGRRQGRGLELGGLLGNGNPGDRSWTQVVQLPGWPLAQSVAPQFTWVPIECAAASQGW